MLELTPSSIRTLSELREVVYDKAWLENNKEILLSTNIRYDITWDNLS